MDSPHCARAFLISAGILARPAWDASSHRDRAKCSRVGHEMPNMKHQQLHQHLRHIFSHWRRRTLSNLLCILKFPITTRSMTSAYKQVNGNIYMRSTGNMPCNNPRYRQRGGLVRKRIVDVFSCKTGTASLGHHLPHGGFPCRRSVVTPSWGAQIPRRLAKFPQTFLTSSPRSHASADGDQCAWNGLHDRCA